MKSGFSDYEAKRRKLTEAISLQYTVKGGVKTEVNCKVGERKHNHAHAHTHTHAHTLTYKGIQQTLPKKGQKGQKKNKNKVNTVKKLKKGSQWFSRQHLENLVWRGGGAGGERKIPIVLQTSDAVTL